MLTFHTLLESISLVAWLADTGGDVVDDGAGGCPATGPRAGVTTGPARAGLAGAAVRVEETLWPAALEGVAMKARAAGTPALALSGGAGGSGATGAGVAGIVLS